MAFSLLPDLILDAVTDISPALLQKHGVRFLMMDFDNTLVPYTTDEPELAVIDWLRRMQNSDITICMVSNSHKPRVRLFCERYGICCIQAARKPFWRVGIAKALRAFTISPEAAAIVGDQIFTDILGGNGAKVMTVLVRPLRLSNIWLKLRHAVEKPFILMGRWRISHEKS